MLELIVPETEMFDEETNEFLYENGATLHLEHSLISVSKWESKWKKPWFANEIKSVRETRDYIRCMCLDKNVPAGIFDTMPMSSIREVEKYIDDPMTATTFRNDPNQKKSHEIITAEIIYYWMTIFGIPSEYQKWHLNRLLTLIQVCSIKSQKPKPMSRREQAQMYHDLNAQRRANFGTKG